MFQESQFVSYPISTPAHQPTIEHTRPKIDPIKKLRHLLSKEKLCLNKKEKRITAIIKNVLENLFGVTQKKLLQDQ